MPSGSTSGESFIEASTRLGCSVFPGLSVPKSAGIVEGEETSFKDEVMLDQQLMTAFQAGLRHSLDDPDHDAMSKEGGVLVSVDGRCWVELICRFSTRILRSKAPKLEESYSLEEVGSLQSAELTLADSMHVSSCSVRLRFNTRCIGHTSTCIFSLFEQKDFFQWSPLTVATSPVGSDACTCTSQLVLVAVDRDANLCCGPFLLSC